MTIISCCVQIVIEVILNSIFYFTLTGIVKLMVSRNPEIVKEADAIGRTPLHYAALRGNLEATRVLTQCDSSVSYILHKSGMSALHVAAYAGQAKVLEELIQ